MKKQELTYWNALFAGIEEIQGINDIDNERYHDQLEKYLKEEGFNNGKIILPGLKFSADIGRDGFFIIKNVDDVLETQEYIATQCNQEYKNAIQRKFRFYGSIIYNGRGTDTEIHFLLLRKRLGEEFKRKQECLLSADFIYSLNRTKEFYYRYPILQEEMEKNNNLENFEAFCLKNQQKNFN